MSRTTVTLADILREDPRYKIEAYEFVYEAIEYTKRQLMADRSARRVTHITPRQLVEGVRDMALERFGYLAADVLKRWGIRSGSDVGEIIFNLVATGDVELGPGERREDFDGICDYEEELARHFRIAAQ